VPLKYPPLKDRPDVLADWIELRTLADTNGIFRLGNLKRLWDTKRNSEDTDLEGRSTEEENTDDDGVSGFDEEKFLDALVDELSDRANTLKDSYPFKFTTDGLRFQLKEDPTVGGTTYLFCILFEHHKEGELWDGSWIPDITHIERDLFQACSTLAAAGFINGSAISFGWPRPNDNPPFLRKLHEVYAAFGEGKPRSKPLAGVSPMVKDEEIDVIAWRPRSDGAAGTNYLLGQVASGDNWTGKSIKAGMDYFHENWFEIRPPSHAHAVPAIFIPHAVPPVGTGTRKDRIARLTSYFGSVFDRMILPTLVQQGHKLASDKSNGFLIERFDDYTKIVNWVSAQVDSVRRHADGLPL
jgi:hypothetical protein